MPRASDGSYNLPLPAVVSGTVITSAWANDTTNDISTALADSLSRSGSGSMTAPLKGFSGTQAAPGYCFSTDQTSGLYLAGIGDVIMSVEGVNLMRWNNGNVFKWNSVDSTWDALLTSGDFTSEIETAVQTYLDTNLQTQVNVAVLDAPVNVTEETGVSYTLELEDSNTVIQTNNSGANSVTIPPNSSVAFPVGISVGIVQTGAGATTVIAGSGVTILNENGLILNAQYAYCNLIKVATNTWIASGSLRAS